MNEQYAEHLVASYKESAVDGMDYFLRNFSHVPDERLTWTATPTAKSAVRIAAHTALYAGRFARMIEDRKLSETDDLAAWLAQREKEEIALTDREEVERVFREGTERVLAALDGLPADAVASSLKSSMGWSMPMTRLMSLPGWHATLHAGQIDFLQTCWDDQEIYL